jgi:organic solute transporter Ostalpha
MPAFFTVFSFLSICFYNEAKYLLPVADFYEAFALVAIFYYMNLVVLPAAPRRTMSFYGGDVSSLEQYVPGGDLARYSVSPLYTLPSFLELIRLKKTWIAVFQILPGRILLTIIQWIVDAVWCTGSSRLNTLTTIINVLNGIQTAICILAILRFYGQAKPQLQSHKIVFKLVVFKIPIILEFLQKAIFSGLNTHNDLKPTATISQADWWYGIPAILTACEMFLISWFFIPAYSWRPFTSKYAGESHKSRRSCFGGVFDVLNISDIFSGIMFALKLRSDANSSYRSSGNAPYEAQQDTGYSPQPNSAYMPAGRDEEDSAYQKYERRY